MPRSRVLSFMSTWASGSGPKSPTFDEGRRPSPSNENAARRVPANIDTSTPSKLDSGANSPASPSTPSRARGDSKARPTSMVQTYNPPHVNQAQDTPPELQPIFSYLNSHSNKLYQEGYFLKLHDLDSRGRPSADRTWVESFAQLIGTVLSLWDANALDVAGEDGEVVPTFINLSDASIKMIESLPMSGVAGGHLQNVLSISTAANNRYLLHFNSLSSLTQWTAGIRLAMFEHTTLQEAYTGSLLAGKGKYLNNIKQIMFRTQFAYEDWARVRFGAGTPWQRCWCVINPPDEKEYSKAAKTLKKSSAYERAPLPKGDIKFYDTRKVTKKTRPIATIKDAYAAYAIYPQSKPLIDQSTLVKLEGVVTMHEPSESTFEGFVFVMPEVHAAVTGFEMMLRWLFPVFDTFALYGRPTKLIADTLDQRGLMFAMPNNRRYGWLDTLDVSGLIHAKGSSGWSERKWRHEMRKLTAERMTQQLEGRPSSRQASQRRNTLSPGGVRFGRQDEYVRSTPGSRSASPGQEPDPDGRRLPRTDSAPPTQQPFSSPHKRSVSEALSGYKSYQAETPSRLSYEANRQDEDDLPPPPPPHGSTLTAMGMGSASATSSRTRLERIESEGVVPTLAATSAGNQQPLASPHLLPPEPVGAPPAFTHSPNSRPENTPSVKPELRRAQSNVDAATLYQMQDAVRRDRSPDDRTPDEEMWNGEVQQRQQNTVASQPHMKSLAVPADRSQAIVNRQQQPRDPRQRLSTIPGSPYVSDGAQYFQSPVQMAPQQMDSVMEAPPPQPKGLPPTPPVDARPGPPTPLHSSKSIARKPVPGKPVPEAPVPRDRNVSDEVPSPGTVLNDENWHGGLIDEEALERVLNQADRKNTMQSTTTNSTEPDYASTVSERSNRSPKKSMERPRAGKLKTVGDPDAGRFDPSRSDQAAQSKEIPDVNFGPTYALKPTSRPGTSDTLTQADMAEKRRSRSADRLGDMKSGAVGVSPRPSPNEANRLSYFSSTGRSTPSPGRVTPTPEYTMGGDRSTMAWQPNLSPSQMHRSKTSVTPEEWVQQRAAMSQQQPQYAVPRKSLSHIFHGRSNSATGQRKLTKTPPLGRTLSGDWTQAGRQSPPARPSSRGAGVNLDTAGSSLSAKEQMQVSRATGTPLINLASNANTTQTEQPGMVGYVAARERDKAASREGRNSVAVQQAIIERQQQQMRLDAEVQAQTQALAQAQQQYQLQLQQQQQMNYNAMMAAQQGQREQRPQVQNRFSWLSQSPQQQQQQQQQQTPVYATQSGSPYGQQQVYSPGGYPQQQQQQQQMQQGYHQGYQQPYGASYYQQQQGQGQGQGQGQQWSRRQ